MYREVPCLLWELILINTVMPDVTDNQNLEFLDSNLETPKENAQGYNLIADSGKDLSVFMGVKNTCRKKNDY